MTEASTPALGAGNVTIVLDGQTVTLKPSYGAAKAISAHAGGIAGAVERVSKLDVDMIELVIAVGMGHVGNRPPPKDLGERIWRTGLSDSSGLMERVVTYLLVLVNGGRLPTEDEVAGLMASDERPPQT